MRNVDFKANEWEVTTAIANQVLHVCPGHFVTGPKERLPDLKVRLNKSPAGGVGNHGSGTFTMTTSEGKRFQSISRASDLRPSEGEKAPVHPQRKPGRTVLELGRVPFVESDDAKGRARRISTL
jgi:RNA-dependent RNA polymerase